MFRQLSETSGECARPDCEGLIYPGKKYWKKGRLFYCCGDCAFPIALKISFDFVEKGN